MLQPLLILLLFFTIFGNINFVAGNLDQPQFQSQENLFQVDVTNPICSKCKLYAIFIESVRRRSSMFVGDYDTVKYFDFSSTSFTNCHEKLIPINIWQDWWERFVKMFLRDQLACFADFVELTLLAVFLLLPVPTCFLTVCLPTFFAAVLKLYLLLTTTSVSGAANSNQSAATRFPTRTINLLNWSIAGLPISCARTANHLPRCSSLSLLNGISTCSKHPSCSVFFGRNEWWILSQTSKQDECYRSIQKFFFTACVFQSNVKPMKWFLEQRSDLWVTKCLIVHVLSSDYNVPRFSFEMKGKQRSIRDFVLPILLYSNWSKLWSMPSLCVVLNLGIFWTLSRFLCRMDKEVELLEILWYQAYRAKCSRNQGCYKLNQ